VIGQVKLESETHQKLACFKEETYQKLAGLKEEINE